MTWSTRRDANGNPAFDMAMKAENRDAQNATQEQNW